jgi:Predicted HD superfamily hydrolase
MSTNTHIPFSTPLTILLASKKPRRFLEYQDCVGDLVGNPRVQLMGGFIQHGRVTCLEHCVNVSYTSYRLCQLLGLDSRSAARGALLHDFFLYDWHVKEDIVGVHAFDHPSTALKNAEENFILNPIERDIIKKHMWPLTLSLPKYAESMLVTFVDKYATICEFFQKFSNSPPATESGLT